MPITTKETIIETANELRAKMKKLEKELRIFKNTIIGINDGELVDKGECIAQEIIALRDLENSRMRLGKIIQYAEGYNIYDK